VGPRVRIDMEKKAFSRTPANLSGLAPRQGRLGLAGFPQLFAAPSGGQALMLVGVP